MENDVILALDKLQKYSTSFRELINEPRRHFKLRKWAFKDFIIICSGMDILDDTILGLRSYIENHHGDIGLAYLEIFGVLQSLYVQQDVIKTFYEKITDSTINLNEYSDEIKIIRDTRNTIVGHPIDSQGKSHHIIRYSISKINFETISYNKDMDSIKSTVNLIEFIEKQSHILSQPLHDVIKNMEKENQEHISKYRERSLASIFDNISYYTSKLFEAIGDRSEIGNIGVVSIEKVLSTFTEDLNERSLHYISNGHTDMSKIDHAINKFKEYMNSDHNINDDDAYIFVSFIAQELERLSTIASEIDEDYST